MSIEDRLKELIIERYGSVIDFSKEIDMANSTLASILSRGIHKASIGNIIKICNALEISADGLAMDMIMPNDKTQEAIQQPTDIDEIISITKLNITAYNLTIDGEPIDNDEKQAIIDTLELCAEFIRRNHARHKKDSQG